MATAQILKHNREVVLSAYRTVLRSTRIAFQDDIMTLQSSRQFARSSFDANRKAAPGSVEAEQGIEHALGAAQILRENVVQGARASENEPYKLRIHEQTERGDNETIRKLKGTSKSFASMRN
ncbi:hypothetical protein MBLNU459_g1849t1 [Dothideomycetes sp. NU459]